MSYSNLEKNFLKSLLASKARPDGRSFDAVRDLELRFGSEYGHAEVRLGKTRLIVQISASVRFPSAERPFEGLFHITTDISSMASPQFENGRSSGSEEILVSRVIEKAIRRSNALDLESLCIVAGKRCWMVRADVHYLDYDGGLVDASCIGVIAALLHFRRPDTSIEGGNVIVHDLAERPPVPLSVLHLPISLSWSFVEIAKGDEAGGSGNGDGASDDDASMSDTDEFNNDGGDDGAASSAGGGGAARALASTRTVALVDATAAEQALRAGEITITVNKDREICQITKAGGAQLSARTLLKFTESAHEFAKRVTKLIYAELDADFRQRNHGNLGTDLAQDSALNER